jgi:hypothetical protein
VQVTCDGDSTASPCLGEQAPGLQAPSGWEAGYPPSKRWVSRFCIYGWDSLRIFSRWRLSPILQYQLWRPPIEKGLIHLVDPLFNTHPPITRDDKLFSGWMNLILNSAEKEVVYLIVAAC